MPTAVIYARFSCSKQREASIDDQLRVCREWCVREGYSVVSEYRDYAVSGRTDARPEFQRMIANAGESDIVLVYMMDRFSRDIYDAPIYKKILRDAGVKVVSATETLPDGPESMLLESMYEAMAAMESAKNSIRTKRGMEGKALQGLYTGDRVFGYVEDKNTGRYAVSEPDAAIVREVFSRRVQGQSYNSIAREMASRGVKTYTGKPCSPTMIQHMVKNPRYYGLYKWGSIEIEDGMPAIVERDVWNMAQRVSKGKRADRESWDSYALVGKAICSCGRNSVGVSGRSSSGKKYMYYRCGANCGVKPVRKELLENELADALRELVSDRDTALRIGQIVEDYASTSNTQAEIERAEKMLRESTSALDNIQRSIEMGIFTDKTQQRIAELTAEKNRAESLIETLNGELPTADDLADFLQFAATLDDTKLVDALVHQVVIGDSEIYAVLNYDVDNAPAVIDFERSNLDAGGESFEQKEVRTPSSQDESLDVRTECTWLPTHLTFRTSQLGIYNGKLALVIRRAA